MTEDMNFERSTNAEILARREPREFRFNSRHFETLLAFVQYNESGDPNYICRDNDFLFRENEKAPMTCSLNLAYLIGNRLDNLPDFILEYCEKHDFIPKEVTVEYQLIDP